MRYATSVGTGRDRERTEYGELLNTLRTACAIRSASAVSTATEAIDRYHVARGGRPGATRTAAPVQPTASRGRPGGSAVADLREIRNFLAGAVRSLTSPIRLATPATRTAGGGRLVYDDDAVDDLDFEEVVTEAEQRRLFRQLCG